MQKDKKSKSLGKAVISLLLIIGITIAILGFIPLQHPIITNKILTIAKANGFDTCSIDSIKVRLWKSIEMKGLSVKTSSFANAHLNLRAEYCKIEPNLQYISILFSFYDKQSRSVSIEQKIKLIKAFQCKVSSLQIERSGENVLLKNFEFAMNEENTDSARYNGKFKIDSLLIDQNILTSMDGSIVFNSISSVNIEECNGMIWGGKITCNGEVDLQKERVKFLESRVSGINVEDYYSIGNKYAGKITGTADVTISLTKSMLNQDSLTGNGTFVASNMNLVNLPVQKALVSLLGFPQLGNVKFDTVRSDFIIKCGQIIPDTITGAGPTLDFSSTGWFNVNGTFNQNISCVLEKEFVETLPGIVSESMRPTADNGRYFKCRLYGSIDHPKMELSKETLKKAFSGAFDNMKQQIEEAFTGK